MYITEIYKSIQGESTYAGLPCVFVRLTGCNLRCDWCDSEYTFAGGHRMELRQILDRVEQLSPDGGFVEITGGEPLLQEREVIPLMESLLNSGYTVLLETSGERPLELVPKAVVKIVDVKCPDSGMGDSFCSQNLDCLDSKDEVKFVISSKKDYDFAREFVSQNVLDRRVNAVLFSPAFSKNATGSRDASHCAVDPRELAEWMLADGVPARLNLQLHKFIWDPALKGV